LLIDDEADFLNLIEQFLSRLGYNVIAFGDPLQGLEYFKSNWSKILLIITDWKMPNMNGLMLASQIRRLNDMVKIIMLTAYDIGMIKKHQDYETAKMYKVIQKPLRLTLLKNLLNEML